MAVEPTTNRAAISASTSMASRPPASMSSTTISRGVPVVNIRTAMLVSGGPAPSAGR
jgi:hypothetical protein